jgi:HEAT repeat protein
VSSTLSPSGMGGDESVLKNAKVSTTSRGLLNFLRRRTPPAPDKEKIAELVKQLSSKDSSKQDEAQGELVCIGQPAVPLLRQAANNVDDVQGSARARQALTSIEGPGGAAVTLNAVRLLASARPAGSTEALIGYLPYAEDDTVFKEIEGALVSVAPRTGKPDPALFKALRDKVAIRRGTAAQVLSQVGGPTCYRAVRPLLKDANPSVRLRAALGLVGAYDAEAIPVLIDLLAELPPDMRTQAEEYLTTLAGEWAVRGPKGNDEMSRTLRRDVWAAWWKNTDGAKLLREFKSRTLPDDERDKVLKLIKKLDDPSAEERQAASDALIGMGRKVTPLLRRALNDNDPKTAGALAKCLEAIEKDTPNPLPSAAPRLLALRKPEGTVPALIAYLPFAESDDVAQQIIDVLAAAGCPGGKADEALVKALSDKIPARRTSRSGCAPGRPWPAPARRRRSRS